MNRTGAIFGCVVSLSLSATLALADEIKLPLWPEKSPVGDGTFEPASGAILVHLAPADKANGAAMVICPGGGYRGKVLGAEGHGIAAWLNDHGIEGIVLDYRLPAGRASVPMLDAQRAIRLVRSHAAEWKLDPKRVGIIGFSAGGHLASTAGTHFDLGRSDASDPVEQLSCRPDFVILVYPVVTMNTWGHAGSRTNLLGAEPRPELLKLFSNEEQVTDQTPPMFLAHPVDDKVVPIDNSRKLYAALQAHNVPAELLELPSGGHGLNGYKGPMWDAWQKRSLEWLAERGMTPK